jgi:PqqD family protein of HPr-rel-A system
VRRSEGISSATVQGEAVLLDTRRGSYYTLNPTGAAVWELLAEPRSLAELRTALLERFDVDAETLSGDLGHLLDELRQHGLVDEDR